MNPKELKILWGMLAVFLVAGGLIMGSLYWMGTATSVTPTPQTDTAATSQNIEDPQDSSPPPASTPTPSPGKLAITQTSTTQFSNDKLYSLINGYRREKKLSPLKAHVLLEQSATAKLRDMQNNKYWAHRDPQGRESWYFLEENGYHFEKAGENLSFGNNTEWKIFDEWSKSPEHNAQLLTPEYEHMGLAADCNSYQTGGLHSCVVVLHLGKQLL